MTQARRIPPTMDPALVARVDARLAQATADEDIVVLWAIESGSRAWGFPSPDSDYDCRFIFRRPLDRYLSLFPPRDVVETPLDKELDVNGWDIGKALRLMLKGNAVVVEWLTSPIVYQGDEAFHRRFLDLAERFGRREHVARHYLHLGERQRRIAFGDGHAVALKKIFYVLRPAAALRWLRLHPDQRVAPMHFPTLTASCAMPMPLTEVIDDLLRRKAVTRELGTGPVPAVVADFLDAEFERARATFDTAAAGISEEALGAAEAFLRDILHGRCLSAG